jgi:hypothetical protein
VLCAGAALAGVAQEGPGPSAEALLERARAHAVALAGAAAVIVAEERARQDAVALPFGGRAPRPSRLSRTITGDIVFMRLTGAPGWLTLRDVYEVDDEVVGERTDRVLNLVLESQEAALAEFAHIYDDAIRHGLAGMPRVLSAPTLGLVAIHPGYAPRFDIRPRGFDRVDGRTARVYEYEETGRPTLMPGPEDTAFPLRGRILVDVEEGVVLRTLVRASAGRLLTGSATVYFGYDERLRAWLPVKMEDQYRQGGSPWNHRGETTFTNYRCYRDGEFEPSAGAC